jgi:hypothetical protein
MLYALVDDYDLLRHMIQTYAVLTIISFILITLLLVEL